MIRWEPKDSHPPSENHHVPSWKSCVVAEKASLPSQWPPRPSPCACCLVPSLKPRLYTLALQVKLETLRLKQEPGARWQYQKMPSSSSPTCRTLGHQEETRDKGRHGRGPLKTLPTRRSISPRGEGDHRTLPLEGNLSQGTAHLGDSLERV